MSSTERSIRHAVMTNLIAQNDVESHGTCGGRRVHAELTLEHGPVELDETSPLLMRGWTVIGFGKKGRSAVSDDDESIQTL